MRGLSSDVQIYEFTRSILSIILCANLFGFCGWSSLIRTLRRCLSFLHCPQEAKFYYGEPTDGKKKAACGAWGEAHCFGNPRLMGADSGNQEKDEIFEHHRKFKYKILNNKRKLEICQKLQGDLNKCLQNAVGDR